MATSGGISLEVTIDDAAVQALLSRALRRADALTPPLREMGELVLGRILHHFETESGPDGAWKALGAATIRAKERAGYSRKPLQRTGRMIGSFHARVGKTEVSISSNARSVNGFPYPLVHNEGSRDGRIPQREFAWLSRKDEDALDNILVRHLTANE